MSLKISCLRALCAMFAGVAAVVALAAPTAPARADSASAPSPATSAASPWARTEQAAVRLISGRRTVGPSGRVRLGLEFRLKPGWHIYWRAPGDAGYPPHMEWTDARNLAGTEVSWPLPKRYAIFGLNTFVYGDHVILPLDARVEDPTRPLTIAGTVSYLVCEQICVPYDSNLALEIPAGGGPAQPTAFAPAIKSFADKVPPRITDPESAPLGITSAALVRGARGYVLEVLARADEPFADPDLLVEGPSMLRFGKPRVERGHDTRTALIRVPASVAGGRGAVPDRPHLVLTLADRGRAVEQEITARSHVAGSAGSGLWGILALALLGGLILNLMPCVLPVLSLKLLGVVGHGGGVRAEVRRGFLATTAGILASFWVLAGTAVSLRATGAAVGWGMQFQSPVFLAFLAVVVTVFAASLFGFLHIPMPGVAGRLAAAAPNERHSLIGAFATGAFATLLATPCSAPFLGTALGFALTRGAVDIFAVFTALGLGLAVPFLAVAAFPGLATRLPKPGPWMKWLRIVLGVALLATAVWLLTVLRIVASPAGAALAAGLLVLLLVVFALRDRVGPLSRAGGTATIAVIALLAVAAPAIAPVVSPVVGGRVGASEVWARGEAIPWRPFDKVEIHNLVAQGRVVFVDVTADWCITCKANKALVIERGDVAKALASGDVVAMKADWTRPDPAISAYLESFGRYGIPFNAVYGPNAPGGIVLPELLDQGVVRHALAKAGAARFAGQ